MMKPGANFLARRLPDFCVLIYAAAATIGAFTGGIWASLGIGFALIMFACVWRLEKRAPLPPADLLVFIALALGVFGLLNFHSTQPKLSWPMWGQLITIFLPLALLANPDIQKRALSARLFALLPVFVALGALSLGLELVLQGPLLKLVRGPSAQLFQYDRGFSYLVILAFPAMAGLWVMKKRRFIAPFIVILLFPASLTESRAAKLALILGLITVAVAYYLPRLTRYALVALSCLVVGWPFAAQKLFLEKHGWINHLPFSWQDRMEIWDYVSYRILDRPIFGWGLGSSVTLPFAKPHGALYTHVLIERSHPHNAILQLWVELGLPGLAFGVAFMLLALGRAGRLPPAIAPFAMGAWMAAFCLAMISYSLWTDSLWAAFALTAFAFALLKREMPGPDSRG